MGFAVPPAHDFQSRTRVAWGGDGRRPTRSSSSLAAEAGRTPDPTLSTRAKQRSTHNSYVTFPVIFMMLSNHYPLTYGHPLNWLVLSLLIVVGVAMDTVQQVESQLIMRHYDGFMKKTRIRGRRGQ